MRKVLVAVLLLLIASSAFAGTITSLSPSSFKVNSGEYFITVYGTNPGNTLVFDGPAGHFERAVSATFTGNVVGWIPEAIVAKAGTHSLKVRDANGIETNSLSFDVVGFKFFDLAMLVPDVLFVQAQSRSGATVKFDVYAVGGEDPNPTAKCDIDSGSFFKMGNTVVNCTASNSLGERADAKFTITVADRVGPVVTVPSDIRVPARSNEGAIVEFSPKAVDDIYGDMPVDCAPKSGSMFHIGKTTVSCTSVDLDNNVGASAFLVEVTSDKTPNPLTLVLPTAMQIIAKDPNGEKVTYAVTVKGTKDPNPVVTCAPKSGSLFPLGSTIVSCDALDVDGGWGQGTFEVNVLDGNPPTILSLKPSIDRIPADGRMYPIELFADVTDDLDLRPTCAIVGVTSNEIIDAGDTDKPSYDYQVTGPTTVDLRGQFTRASRVYNVWMGCSDFFGNMSQSYVQVLVTGAGGQSAPSGRRRAGAKP
jgi:hypothetical protein